MDRDSSHFRLFPVQYSCTASGDLGRKLTLLFQQNTESEMLFSAKSGTSVMTHLENALKKDMSVLEHSVIELSG